MLDYTDALILLTNASSTPLGRALALTYARHGARLILLDLSSSSSPTTTTALANHLRAAGHSAWPFTLDPSPSPTEQDHDLAALALRVVSNVGIPDILHCHDDGHDADDADDADDATTDVLPAPEALSRGFAGSVVGAVRAVRAFAPAMRRRGAGWVVLTGSAAAYGVAGGGGGGADVVRGVCAAGVASLGQGLAVGLRGSGVGVTVVYPPRVVGEGGRGDGGPVKGEEDEEGRVFAGWDLKAGAKGRRMSVEEAAERMVEGVRGQKFCVSADEMFETVLVHWAMNGFDPNIEYPVRC